MTKEEKKIYMVKYRAENKEKLAASEKKYREENKEEVTKRRKIYKENNREKLRLAAEKYREENKNKIKVPEPLKPPQIKPSEQKLRKPQKTIEEIREYNREYQRKRYAEIKALRPPKPAKIKVKKPAPIKIVKPLKIKVPKTLEINIGKPRGQKLAYKPVGDDEEAKFNLLKIQCLNLKLYGSVYGN